MTAELVRPHVRYMPSFVAALHEGYSRDTLRPETPETIATIAAEPDAFVRQMLNPPRTVVLPDGTLGERVPETHFWYVDGDEFLGAISVRHPLNDKLEAWGGHIGYGVRPSARGRGHAGAMLAAALDWTRANLPLDRVTLHVNANNAASIRVIEKAGGIREATVPHPWIAGDQGHRYRIEVP